MNEMKVCDPCLEEKMKKDAKRDLRTDHVFRRTLHWLERIIAVVTLLGLAGALVMECYELVVHVSYLQDLSLLLHNLLGIVVGLEFVRMLIDTTPANVIEVLVLAITRHVVLSHEDPWSNLLSIVCIAILFAVRRYLIRRDELQEELVEE